MNLNHTSNQRLIWDNLCRHLYEIINFFKPFIAIQREEYQNLKLEQELIPLRQKYCAFRTLSVFEPRLDSFIVVGKNVFIDSVKVWSSLRAAEIRTWIRIWTSHVASGWDLLGEHSNQTLFHVTVVMYKVRRKVLGARWLSYILKTDLMILVSQGSFGGAQKERSCHE